MSDTTPSATEASDAINGNDMFDLMSGVDVPGDAPDTFHAFSGDEDLGEESGEETEETSTEEGEGDDTSEGESSEEGDAEGEQEQPETASSSDAQSFKAKHGDKDVSVPEDAVFTVKIDGKDETVTAKELVRNYQGKIPLERHFRESKELRKQLDTEKAQIQSDVQVLSSQLDDILNTFEDNPYLAFEKIAEMRGKNPGDYLPIFIAQSRATIEELDTLSEAEAQALILQRKLTYKEKALSESQKRIENTQKHISTKQARDAADAYFTQQVETNGYTAEEVDAAVQFFKVANESKQIDLTSMDPKEVAELMLDYIPNVERKFARMERALDKVDPALKEDRELISELSKLVDPTLTEDDIEEIIRAVTGKSSDPKAVKPKVSSSQSVSPQGISKVPANSGAPRSPSEGEKRKVGGVSLNDTGNYFSIDDILSEYR